MRKVTWVDSEVHLLPPEWCRPEYMPPAGERVMRRVVYEHPEREAALSRATVDELLVEMETAGIDRAVIMGLPWYDPELCRRNNAYISETVERYPGRFTGLGVLPPPGCGKLDDAVRRLAEDHGLVGAKVIPSWHGYRLNDPVFEPALRALSELDLVLMPHTDHAYLSPDRSDTAYGLFDVAKRYPNLRILAPHLGGLLCLYNLYPPVAEVLRNILFITTVPLTMRMVEFAVGAAGAERLAFGTDFPFNPSHDQRSARRTFEALEMVEADRHLICGSNVLEFLACAPMDGWSMSDRKRDGR